MPQTVETFLVVVSEVDYWPPPTDGVPFHVAPVQVSEVFHDTLGGAINLEVFTDHGFWSPLWPSFSDLRESDDRAWRLTLSVDWDVESYESEFSTLGWVRPLISRIEAVVRDSPPGDDDALAKNLAKVPIPDHGLLAEAGETVGDAFWKYRHAKRGRVVVVDLGGVIKTSAIDTPEEGQAASIVELVLGVVDVLDAFDRLVGWDYRSVFVDPDAFEEAIVEPEWVSDGRVFLGVADAVRKGDLHDAKALLSAECARLSTEDPYWSLADQAVRALNDDSYTRGTPKSATQTIRFGVEQGHELAMLTHTHRETCDVGEHRTGADGNTTSQLCSLLTDIGEQSTAEALLEAGLGNVGLCSRDVLLRYRAHLSLEDMSIPEEMLDFFLREPLLHTAGDREQCIDLILDVAAESGAVEVVNKTLLSYWKTVAQHDRDNPYVLTHLHRALPDSVSLILSDLDRTVDLLKQAADIGRSEGLMDLTYAADAVAARCLERHGDVHAAIGLAEASIDEESADPVTSDRLSLYYERQREFARAAAICERCLDRNRDLPGFTRLLQTLERRRDRCRAKASQQA